MVGTQLRRVLFRVFVLLLCVHIQSSTARSLLSEFGSSSLNGGNLRVLGVLDANGGFFGDIVGIGDEGFLVEFDQLDVAADASPHFTSPVNRTLKTYKFQVCAPHWKDYIPCLDNPEGAIGKQLKARGELGERHCPRKGSMCCSIAAPLHYRLPIRWPKSRNEIRFNNVPRAQSLAEKSGVNWVKRKKDKLLFPGGDIQYARGAHQYLDHIGEMLPSIGYGSRTRVALDFGCGVGSLAAALLDRDVLALCISPKDDPESQVAMERGVPSLVAVLGTRRLLFPSQAFDLVHCSRCQVNWTRDDGILLVEADRVLRAGAYFVWSPQDNEAHAWRDMEDLAKRLCWEQVGKDEVAAIWRKPRNNTNCLTSRPPDTSAPARCEETADPDKTWYIPLQLCITVLPETQVQVPEWPARLSTPPARLKNVDMDAGFPARAQVFKSDQNYWHEVVDSYLRGLGLHKEQFRNVMDMRAMLGGFATALVNLKVDWWVMNVVPISGPNTLPIIYDRGLIGISHDWCEPFDTFPRTYDMLHAVGVFSNEQKRCNIAHLVLEMDRILRPGGWVLVRESNDMAIQVQSLAKAIRWKTKLLETESGPFGKDKLLACQKLVWHS